LKVVFLCGGVGRRMFPITEDKFSLKFLGKTLLEHQVERALASGLPRGLPRLRSVLLSRGSQRGWPRLFKAPKSW